MDPKNGLLGFGQLLVLQLVGEWLSRAFGLPMPGPVLGMLLLLPLLRWAWVREPVGQAAQFLLSHLSLLFLPVGVGLITHLNLIDQFGLMLFAIVVVSTWVGLAVSAVCYSLLSRRTAQKR